MGKWHHGQPLAWPPPASKRRRAGPAAALKSVRAGGSCRRQQAQGTGPKPGEGREAGTLRGDGRQQQGAAALEFALVLPLFLILWFAVVEFGLVLYAKGLITHASQEGARFGSVYRLAPPTTGDIQAHVQSYLQGAGFSGPVTVTVTGAGGSSGTPLSVRVDYTYIFMWLPNFLAGMSHGLNLSAESVKRLE